MNTPFHVQKPQVSSSYLAVDRMSSDRAPLWLCSATERHSCMNLGTKCLHCRTRYRWEYFRVQACISDRRPNLPHFGPLCHLYSDLSELAANFVSSRPQICLFGTYQGRKSLAEHARDARPQLQRVLECGTPPKSVPMRSPRALRVPPPRRGSKMSRQSVCPAVSRVEVISGLSRLTARSPPSSSRHARITATSPVLRPENCSADSRDQGSLDQAGAECPRRAR